MISSDKVKKWRKATKDKIVQLMGGECKLCGYKKCSQALELHHYNPTEKDFSFGAIRANPKSWLKILKELEKCILLCSNCHKEVHAGLTEVKLIENIFTSQQETLNFLKDKSLCPVCGKSKMIYQNTCGQSCGNKLSNKEKNKQTISRRKVIWPLKEELLSLLEKKPITQIGKQFNVSDNAVRKWCRAYNINFKEISPFTKNK
jgi:predicted nucleic acid-binding Zn ribbon protein